jgi:transcriptional regulator with GAF, ATPase, and Fis domain
LVNGSSDKLPLVASRGFTPDIQREIASLNKGHRFSQEIVGFGHKIIIPDLSHDNNQDLSIFEKAGFCSLVAVPVMTYRIYGVLGVAYRVRKKIDDDFPDLIAVIANLIGMAFNKFRLNEQPIGKQQPLSTSHPLRLESILISRDTQGVAVKSGDTADIGRTDESETRGHNGDFHDHVRRMRAFIGSHKPR